MELSLHETYYSKEITMNSSVELLPVAVVLGLFVLMTVPLFAVIAVLVVALGGVAALIALTGAVLAAPYLLGHSLLQHLRARSDHRRPQALDGRSTQARLATGDPGWRTG